MRYPVRAGTHARWIGWCLLRWVVLTTMGAAQRGRLDLSQSLVRACQKGNPASEKPSNDFCGPRRAFRRKPRRFSEIRAQNSFLSS